MNRVITTLLLVLLIQLGVSAVVFWPQTNGSNTLTPYSLAGTVDATAIDTIRIGDDSDNEALLQRDSRGWVLPDLENLPADPQMVKRLLDSLTQPRRDWVVADTVTARQRFKVADYRYQRIIDLSHAEQDPARIYLGTSPAFRKVHARRQSENAIYSIDFNLFEAPAVAAAWVDPSLLQVRAPLRISGDGFSISKTAGQWLSGLQLKPHEHELMALLEILRELQINSVASEDEQRELAGLEPQQRLQIESLSGNMTLELFAVGNNRFILSSEYPLYFRLSAYQYEGLADIDFMKISGAAGSE